MDRRTFLSALASGILASPLVVEAQPAQGIRRIGVVEARGFAEARREGLRRLGWIEGQNIIAEHLSMGDGNHSRVQAFARDLVRLKIEVIMASTNSFIEFARAATMTIPIVMVYAVDPVGQGYIASLARRGGNITGLAVDPSPEMRGKLVEFTSARLRRLSTLGALVDPKFPGYRASVGAVEHAARARGIRLRAMELRGPDELEGAIATLVKDGTEAIIVLDGPFLWTLRHRIAEITVRQGLATAYSWRDGPEAGLLLSYGTNLQVAWHHAAIYVDKILRGAKPADLPVEQPTKFELVINLKTAKALGLAIPPLVLQRADQVIE